MGPARKRYISVIIQIKKRYWYYHENSDSIFTGTREGYLASGNEITFLHELGPVVTGSKEEGQTLFNEANEMCEIFWYFADHYREGLKLTREEAKVLSDNRAMLHELGPVVTGTVEEFNALLNNYLPF